MSISLKPGLVMPKPPCAAAVGADILAGLLDEPKRRRRRRPSDDMGDPLIAAAGAILTIAVVAFDPPAQASR